MFTAKWNRPRFRMKAVIFIRVLYLILMRTFTVKGIAKCDSKIEMRAVLLSCPVKDSGCDDDDPLSQAMSVEEAQIVEPSARNFQGTKEAKEKGFPNSVKDCRRKVVITVKMKNVGKIPCDDEYIIVDHVFDPISGGRGRLLSPMILKLRQEQMIQLYGLQFQRAVNSDPYEEQKEPDKDVCSVASENPTCGVALYDGKPIPFSEGFCCSCDPSVNAKRQPPPPSPGGSFLDRDSRLMSRGTSRFARDEKSFAAIANPELVELRPGGLPKSQRREACDEDLELSRPRDLALDKVPNYMFEHDRKIMCDKGDFLNELARMKEEKHKTETEEGAAGPPRRSCDPVARDPDGEPEKQKGTNGLLSGVPTGEAVLAAAAAPDSHPLSQNDLFVESLFGALTAAQVEQTTSPGIPSRDTQQQQQQEQQQQSYGRPKSRQGVRGKRENRQEPPAARSEKKLTLEEKLDKFVKSRKELRNRRKRLLELSHKRFRKAGVRCRDTKECQTVMATDFPEEEYVRSPPPKYFFAHDRFIVDPMEPSELISNSTCRSSEEAEYEDSATEKNQERSSFGKKAGKEGREEERLAEDSVESYERLPKSERKSRLREKWQGGSSKKDRLGHRSGGDVEKEAPRDRARAGEPGDAGRETNLPRAGKKADEEEEEADPRKGAEEPESDGDADADQEDRQQQQQQQQQQSRRNHKAQSTKVHFVPKNIKNVFVKGEERKAAKPKIRNFIMGKVREKQKFKSGFAKTHKKLEEALGEDEGRTRPEGKCKGSSGESPPEYQDHRKSPEGRVFGEEDGGPSETPDAAGGDDAPTGTPAPGAEEAARRGTARAEGSRGESRGKGTPAGRRREEEGRLVDFSFEVIRNQFREPMDRGLHWTKEENFPVEEPDAKPQYAAGQEASPFYKSPQRYYVVEKDRRGYPEKVYFIDDGGAGLGAGLGVDVGVGGGAASGILSPRRFQGSEPAGLQFGDRSRAELRTDRTGGRARPKHDSYYHYGKVPQRRRGPSANHPDGTGIADSQRQTLLTIYEGNKLRRAQHQGQSRSEMPFRKSAEPDEGALETLAEGEDSRDSTPEKIRRKRGAAPFFEPARGFFGSETKFLLGEGRQAPNDESVGHELSGCLSPGRGTPADGPGDVAADRRTPAPADGSNASREATSALRELREKRTRAADKDRLIRSYLNAPDYVLEEVETGRAPGPKGKRDGCDGEGDAGQDTARCMRYGDLWYSMYAIKKPVIAQVADVQLFEKHSHSDGTTQWRDLTKGKMVRIGTFLPKAADELPSVSVTFAGGKTKKLKSAIDPDNYMLLIPSHVSDPAKVAGYPQFEGGPAEYLLVQSRDVSSGGECDMVGTSFEAFARQPDRCSRRRGSCLKRQPTDLWREDVEARIRGKRGKYFVENFGTVPNSPVKTYTNFSGEYLALEYYGEYASTIEIEVKADSNAIVRKGSTAQIPTVFIDGTYPKKTRIVLSVLNVGLTSSYFRPRLGDCPPDLDPAWCPLEGPLVVIPPQQRHDFKLDLSGALPPNKIYATVQVLNQLNKKIAYRRIIIQKGDRCVCAFHCKCNCIGNVLEGRACRQLTLEDYRGAGYVGSFPFRGGASGSSSDGIFANLHVVLLTACYALLFLGLAKAVLGVLVRRVGIAGTRVIVGPRKLRRYYESDLECCSVLFDECGFPVHPTTCQPVQIVPTSVEMVINFFFFFLYPLRGLAFLIMAFPCCKTMCADSDEGRDFDRKCSRPLLSKKHSTSFNYNLTTINTKKVKRDEYHPYLPYTGDDDPLEDDDTEFVLREMKRYRQK